MSYLYLFHYLYLFYFLSTSSQDYTAKLSDFGLAKAGPEGDETHVSTRVMGTYGYAAPEYVMTGMDLYTLYLLCFVLKLMLAVFSFTVCRQSGTY